MMAPTVVFPDAVAFVISVLRKRFDDAGNDAVAVTPGTVEARPCVVVRRIGGSRKNIVVDEPVVRITAIDEEQADACDLGEQARGWLFALARTREFNTTVYGVEGHNLAGDSDPLSDRPEYVFDVKLSLRGTAA